MAFAETDGVRIAYELSGNASGPTLVLSHSLGVQREMWRPQVSLLGSHCQIVRYDTRGHGESPVSAEPFAIRDLGEDVLRLLDFLGIEKASFCGLSMGGVIGQWLGIHASHRLDKLVLANTAAKIGSAETWNGRIATVLEHGLEPVIEGTLERWFTVSFRESHWRTVEATRTMLHETQPGGYAGCCAAIRDADFRLELSSIRTPTLIICGVHDPVSTVADGLFMAERIAGARVVELQAAHLSNVEAAEDFNTELVRFLLD